MTQEEKKGMRLNQSHVLEKTRKNIIIDMGTSLFFLMTLFFVLMEVTGCGEIFNPWIGVLTGTILSLGYALLKKYNLQNYFYPAALILLLALILCFRKYILNGACLFWNQIGKVWTANKGYVLPKLDMGADAPGKELSLLFLMILIGMVLGLLCSFLQKTAPVLLAILLPAVLFAGTFLMGQEMSKGILIPTLVSGLLLLINSGNEKRKEAGAIFSGWIIIALVTVILIPLGSLSSLEEKAAAYSETIHDKIHEHLYETEYTTLPEGDFAEFENIEDTNLPGLIVTMDVPEEMYFRGFTGEVFADNIWVSLDKQVLEQNSDLLYGLNEHEFHINAQFEKAVEGMQWTQQSVTVQNIGACSSYQYLPFSVLNGPYLQAEDLTATAESSEKGKTFVYQVVSGSASMIKPALNYLSEAEEEQILEYRKAETVYREYVYENYLEIPEEVSLILKERWNELAENFGGLEEMTDQEAKLCVLTFMEQCFPEDGSLAPFEIPLGIAQGTDYQYATVAAMTLRYFGIPSRYAEGYVITEEIAKKTKEGEPIELDSSCASAWAEIYQDGIGWIPMSLTPGMNESEENDPNSEKGGGEGQGKGPGMTIPEGQELENPIEPPEELPDEPEYNGGSMVKLPEQWLKELLKIVLVILFILFAIVIRRKIIINRREKQFKDESPKNAVGWIFADTACLLKQLGFDRGNGSMFTLCSKVTERFGEEYGTKFHKMTLLNSSALFSSREMEEIERTEALGFRMETLELIKTNTKWYKRIWLQWICCMY